MIFDWVVLWSLQSFTELEYLILGLVSAVPSFLIPMIWVGKVKLWKYVSYVLFVLLLRCISMLVWLMFVDYMLVLLILFAYRIVSQLIIWIQMLNQRKENFKRISFQPKVSCVSFMLNSKITLELTINFCNFHALGFGISFISISLIFCFYW